MRRSARAFLLAAALVLAVSIPASGAFAAPVAISGGSGDWGVKLSFRNYIAGPIAHGDIAVSDGASLNVDGTYDFPVVDGVVDPDARTGEVQLQGTVRFRGHETPVGSGNYL